MLVPASKRPAKFSIDYSGRRALAGWASSLTSEGLLVGEDCPRSAHCSNTLANLT